MYEFGRRPIIRVVVPLPVAEAPPGEATTVQSPNEGNPLKATLPVEVVQVGCVTVPATGGEGIPTITTEVVETMSGQLPAAGIVHVTV